MNLASHKEYDNVKNIRKLERYWGSTKPAYETPSDRVINMACKIWKIERDALLGDGRNLSYVRPRQAVAYVMVKVFGFSTTQAGLKLKRDHSTIINACQKVDINTKKDINYLNQVSRLIIFAVSLKKGAAK